MQRIIVFPDWYEVGPNLRPIPRESLLAELDTVANCRKGRAYCGPLALSDEGESTTLVHGERLSYIWNSLSLVERTNNDKLII